MRRGGRSTRSGASIAHACAALAVCAWLLCMAPLIAHAAPPAGPPPTPTPLPRTGTLTLSEGHVAHGTTTVGAAISGFRDGERAHVTWSASDASGGPVALGDIVAQPPAGSGVGQLHLPAGAALGTYVVTAAGDGRDGTRAQAFLTVDAPNAPPPSPGPSLSPRAIVPLEFTRGVSATDGNGVELPVSVAGFPPNAHLVVTARLLAGGTHEPVTLGDLGPTTGGGEARASFPIPPSVVAGPYDIEATMRDAPHVAAGASMTLRDSAAKGVGSLSLDAFAGLWTNAVGGLGQFWHGIISEGRDSVLTRVLGVVLYQDDPTTHRTPALVGLMKTFTAIGEGAIGVLVAVRAFTIILGLFRRAQGLGPWLTLTLEIVGVFVAVAALTPVEHAVWGWVNRFVQGSDAHALTPLVEAIKRLTDTDAHALSGTLEGLGALGLLIALAVVFVVIELTRLGGFALLEALYILGPLVVPLLIVRETRSITLWWFRSTLAITSWPLLYLVLIEGGVGIVFSFSGGGGDQAVFGNPLVRVGLGVALVLSLLTVPEWAAQAVARVVSGAGGYVDAHRTPALAPARKAQAWLRDKIPGM